jgi:hypothetical protein
MNIPHPMNVNVGQWSTKLGSILALTKPGLTQKCSGKATAPKTVKYGEALEHRWDGFA